MMKDRRSGSYRDTVMRILSVTTVLFLVQLGAASAGDECDFQQVNEPGFYSGSPNMYIWSMAAYGSDYVYATTNNWSGGEIWRMNVSTGAWVKILSAGDYSQAAGNLGFRNIAVLPNGMVCAGSRYQGESPMGGPPPGGTPGAQLWCSNTSGLDFKMIVGPEGSTFSPLFGAGFGNPDNESIRGMEVFGDTLYIGMQNISGTGEIWRMRMPAEGASIALEDFAKVALPEKMGGPGSGNDSMHSMAANDNNLFVATQNSGGFQVWYTNDGLNFCPLVGPAGTPGCSTVSPIPSGFANAQETTPLDIHLHNGYLFVGTAKPGGFSVFRIDLRNPNPTNSLSETKQVAAGGLGDRWAYYAWQFETFGNVDPACVGAACEKYLWLGNYNYMPLTYSWSRKGASLYRSANNGLNWDMMVGGSRRVDQSYCGIRYGFGDRQNLGIRSFAVVGDTMYIGTGTCGEMCPDYYTGAEVWALQEWTQ